MRLGDLPVGRWFHDSELKIQGKVHRHGEAGTTVRLYRPRNIIIKGQTVATVGFTRPILVTSAWEIEPGRMKKSHEVRTES